MARGLDASDVLWLWEWGRDRHPIDRALLMLSAADPASSAEALSRLTVGQRDARLLDLRIATLGDRIDSTAECPRCATALEFSVSASGLRMPEQPAAGNLPVHCDVVGQRVTLRRPDSRDLARIAALPADADATRVLLEACVVPAELLDGTGDIGALPEAVIAGIPTCLAAADPQADISFELSCAACGHRWSLLFDIGAFFWSEVAALAQRLLREVDALARAYGWREADILSMTPARRRLYLEMVA